MDVEVSVKLPESAILVEFEVFEVVERFLESLTRVAVVVFPEREIAVVVDVSLYERFPESLTRVVVDVEVERLRASVTLAVVLDVVVVLPEFETLDVVDETFPESLTRVEVFVVLGALVVVVVVGALVVVVVVVVVLGAETLVVVLFEFEVAVALVVLVFVTGALSANFHVLKRPFESRTTSRTRPSDQVSVTTLPHVTKWPFVSRTTQYCFPSAHVS